MLQAAPKHIIAISAMQQRLPSASVCGAACGLDLHCAQRLVAVVSPDAVANRACPQPSDANRARLLALLRVDRGCLWLRWCAVVVVVVVVQGRAGHK